VHVCVCLCVRVCMCVYMLCVSLLQLVFVYAILFQPCSYMEGVVKENKPTSLASITDAVSSESDGPGVVNVVSIHKLLMWLRGNNLPIKQHFLYCPYGQCVCIATYQLSLRGVSTSPILGT